MNWDDLRIFLTVARTGSISGAARQLDIQHSTVSRRLQKLEKDLGVRLLDKKRSGYELTAAGEELLSAAQNMEREVLLVDGSVLGMDANLGGTVRVTTVGNMATSLMMPMLARFSQQYPEIELHLTVSNADVSLPEREADVAIRLGNSPSETLVGKKLGRIASTVYGRQDYVERIRSKAEIPRWIGADCCSYHKQWTRKLSGSETFQFYSDEPIVTRDAAINGMGLAVLPCHMGDQEPELARYMEPAPEMDLDLWLLYHVDLKRTERVRIFRNFMTVEFANISDLLEGNVSARRPPAS